MKNNTIIKLLNLVLMVTLVMVSTKLEVTIGARHIHPLSDIMLQGAGIDTRPLACVGLGQPCGPAYWCCEGCNCIFTYSHFYNCEAAGFGKSC
ncbi:hypothetical protein RND81_05G229300 [Saponaria officinalis]|uniref:Uncharacterized protein n=1 Tax=Saponaria officinalis TaxID=3572 RepID=A0AAW1KYY9_SAPOF